MRNTKWNIKNIPKDKDIKINNRLKIIKNIGGLIRWKKLKRLKVLHLLKF